MHSGYLFHLDCYSFGWDLFLYCLNTKLKIKNNKYPVVPAAEIWDQDTGLVSGPFSWFQSRQTFHETHQTEANPIFLYFTGYSLSEAIILASINPKYDCLLN
jgi:hypothetical protein